MNHSKRKLLSLICILVCIQYSNAQIKYGVSQGFSITYKDQILEKPFLGGLNSPQFSEIDLNGDGVMDLVVFDRSDFKIFPFIKVRKGNYQYAPKYEFELPKGKNIYITGDLNSDDQMEIFTLTTNGELEIHMNITKPGDSKLSFNNLGPWYYRNQYDSMEAILYNPLSFSNTITDLPSILDLDNDGDLDLVSYDPFNLTYFMFSDVRADKKWSKDTFEFQNMDYCYGYFWEGFDSEIKLNTCPYSMKLKPRHVGGASCWFFDEDNDGDKEMYLANLDFKRITKLVNGKSQYKTYYDTFISVDTLFLEGKSFDSYIFPAGYMIDVNDDELTDMIIAPNVAVDGKESDQVQVYLNKGTKNKADFKYSQNNFITEQMLDLGGKTSPLFIDLDADGDLDLLVANNGDFHNTQGLHDKIACFMNTGTKNAPNFEFITDDYLKTKDSSIQQIMLTSGDIDNDGDIDILFGTMQGFVYWYENIAGKNNPSQFKFKSNNLLNYKRKSGESSFAPSVIDFNKDGINDILVGLYNGNLLLFEGKNGTVPTYELKSSSAWGMKGNEWLENVSDPTFASYGYSTPAVGDLNNDGEIEVVVGNYFGQPRIYHIENHPYTDSLIAEENFIHYVSEFDTIGNYYVGGKNTPAIADLNGDSIPEIIFGNLRGGLVFTKNLVSKNSVSTDKIVKRHVLNLSPNPLKSGEMALISSPEIQKSWKVNVYNSVGMLIKQSVINKNEKEISVNMTYDSGVYFVELMSTDYSQTANGKLLILK